MINWYPGHMTKAKRTIEAEIKNVDVVCEITDARIPLSSRNPDIDSIIKTKPRILVLNKSDLADDDQNKKWVDYYIKQGYFVMLCDSKNQKTKDIFLKTVSEATKEIVAKRQQRGMGGMNIKVMMLGIPNVGKSTFINCIAQRKAAQAQDKPGVTKGKQWISTKGLDLLDMPGILWPKIESEEQGLLLSSTGAIRDQITDVEYIASYLLEILNKNYNGALKARYNLDDISGLSGYEILEEISKKRGFIKSGGVIDTERGAKIVLDEYRGGKIGRFTLEEPKFN